ncbi:MAG: GAF domain-containing protein [Acidobacteriia bacterium]|nr:GAF domain-containing protein [Terriglobia bacterium]
MADLVLSPGVEIAWQIAGDLALSQQDAFIEPRHLLFGICSVGKLARAEGKTASKTPSAEAGLKQEADRLDDLAQRHGVDLATIRRAVRQSSQGAEAPQSPESGKPRVVSRSPAARWVFERAEQISRDADSGELGLMPMLRAVLEAPDAQISAITASIRQGVEGMLQELRQTASKPAALTVSLGPQLRNLDEGPDLQSVRIAETVDASLTLQPRASSSTMERLTYLSELTWEFGTQGLLESMLQKAVDQLLHIVSTAARCAILVRDASNSELLLKAHGPANTTPRISMTSASRAMAEQKGFIWTRGENLTLSQEESKIEAGMYVPLVVNHEAIGVVCLDSAAPSEHFQHDELLLVASFAHQIALAVANHELRLTLKQNGDVLERLLTNFSPKVRTRLLQRAQLGRLRLGGEQSVVSILCADIRGFARLTASMPTEDVVALLNEYFAALTDCIFRHDGTIDKFVGDAILAVFGSPEADPQHGRNAVMAGVEMQQVMGQVSQRREARGEVTCQIGVGIHTGEVLHGFIGSPERMEYTIIGDAVNRAARYCDGAKGAEVLISPELHQRVWKITDAEQVSIPTKHEGDLPAYRVNRLRPTNS